MRTMLECVRISHSNTWSKDPMMQLKLTALLSPELCVRQMNFHVIAFCLNEVDILLCIFSGMI